MHLDEMLQLVKDRTHYTNNDAAVIRELNSALRWAWQRVTLTNPDLELTFGTAGTFSANTQSWDLAAAITGGELYQIKALWIREDGGEDYTPVVFKDANDPAFIARAIENDTEVIFPVYADVKNFDQIQFANTLPTNTQWKVDWIGKPAELSLGTSVITTVPEVLHDAMIERAVGLIWRTMDDNRFISAFQNAQGLLSTGIQSVKRRQFLTQTRTKPFPAR